MRSITLKQLRTKIFNRISLAGVATLDDLMDLDEKVGGDATFLELLTQSIATFEYYCPLLLHLKIYIDPVNRKYEFTDNFRAFVSGVLTEDTIELIPTGVVGVTRTLDYPGNYLKDFNYNEPYLDLLYLAPGIYTIRGYFNRPLIADFEDNGITLKDEAALYYVDPSMRNIKDAKLLDQMTLDFARHFVRMKENFQLNMPVDLFAGLPELVSQLDTKMDNFYQNRIKEGFGIA